MSKAFQRVAVIDIGKTNAKVVVVETASGREIAVRKTANHVLAGPPYPHFDVDGLWDFILSSLANLAREPGFDAVSITTHGACAALLDLEGGLALPVLDYEHLYPQDVQSAYSALRPAFRETFSPPLPGGLNLGAQLHYQQAMFADDFTRVAQILTYPQYWAFRLTGVAANEVTSLGCHTDLWDPLAGNYSSLIDTLNLRRLMAPIRSAFDALGPLRPEIVEELGLDHAVPVYCGLHDSNASLLPHLLSFGSPCTVVSTGTWVVCFGVGGQLDALDPTEDTLANVDAFARPVPSARFMGGRHWERLTSDLQERQAEGDADVISSVVRSGVKIFPRDAESEEVGRVCGLGNRGWPAGWGWVVASLYEALMTVRCLELIGSDGPVVVEGPFAGNRVYLAALSSLVSRPVYAAASGTGTAQGAALLTGFDGDFSRSELRLVEVSIPGLTDYAADWFSRLQETR